MNWIEFNWNHVVSGRPLISHLDFILSDGCSRFFFTLVGSVRVPSNLRLKLYKSSPSYFSTKLIPSLPRISLLKHLNPNGIIYPVLRVKFAKRCFGDRMDSWSKKKPMYSQTCFCATWWPLKFILILLNALILILQNAKWLFLTF